MTNTTFGLPWPGVADQFLLRRDMSFLNHGSFGACPKPVFDVYQSWQRELESQPVEFLGRRHDALISDARETVGPYIGADPATFVLVPNATFGINIVARSLDLQPGDEVLTTDHEYGAADRTWKFNCNLRGALYTKRPIPYPLPNNKEIVEELWRGVSERTKVIFLSHITSPTAVIFPVAEICRRAREVGIITVIDGAHAPGQVSINMQEIGADFYTGNFHKWLCAPKGAAFLYARPDRQPLLQPLIVSWGWESERPGPSLFLDHFTWPGTSDPSAYLSVGAAIKFQADNDWPSIRAACHSMAMWARNRLVALTGLSPLCAEDQFAQMFAVELPAGSLEKLGTRLWDEYRVEVPLIRWNNRDFFRVSIQAYNKPEDIYQLEDALSTLIN